MAGLVIPVAHLALTEITTAQRAWSFCTDDEPQALELSRSRLNFTTMVPGKRTASITSRLQVISSPSNGFHASEANAASALAKRYRVIRLCLLVRRTRSRRSWTSVTVS